MKVRYTCFLLFLMAFVLSVGAYAQSGSWNPELLNSSFPRTLTTPELLPGVRATLNQPERLSIYNQVFNNAFSAVPAANASSTERRLRARLAKNAAFVYLIDRQNGANISASLTPTQRLALSTKVKSLLKTANVAVETNFSYTEWQWRSKELIDYLVAYDLIRGGGMPADSLVAEKAQLQQFAGNLYANATQNVPYYGSFFGNVKNNHALMTAAALGMAAVVLNDATSANANLQPQNWIQAGMYNLDNVLWRDAARQSVPEQVAGYAEGPYYFKYAFLNLLPFFRAMGNFLPDNSLNYSFNGSTRSIRNPYFDPNYQLLYLWAAAITLPDGRLPALEDSYFDQAMPELALTGNPRFVKPLWLQNLPNVTNTLAKQLDGTVDMRAAWLAAAVTPTNPSDSLVSLPAAGNLIFRSGTDHNANYLHLYGKNGPMLTNSGGHNQADAASFQLYGKGQLLALDPGYLSYSSRTELGNATNHNMILVDGAGPAMGTTGMANDAQAFVSAYFQQHGLSFGEVTTAYQGASIKRKALSVNGEYFILTDFVTAAQPRQFTWQLHGYGLQNGTAGTGTFNPNYNSNTGVWQKNGASLSATVSATGGAATFATATGLHEIGYEARESHSVMQVQQTAQAAAFVAVLQPYDVQQTPKTVIPLAMPGVSGAVVKSDGLEELALAKADTGAFAFSSPDFAVPLVTNAQVCFVGASASGAVSQFMLHEGSLLSVSGNARLTSATRGTFAWKEISFGSGEGYSSVGTKLQLRVSGLAVSVTGTKVQDWAYLGNNLVEITVSGAGSFQVSYSQSTLPVNLVTFTAKAAGQTALLEWKTASEKDNAGFDIQFSEDGLKFTWLAFVAAGTTEKQLVQQYLYSDTSGNKTNTRYYRLLQHDVNGEIHLLGTRAVTCSEAPNLEVSVFPNPFQGQLTVRVNQHAESKLSVEITDLLGRVHYRKEVNAAAGNTEVKIDPEMALPAGVLLVTVRSAAQTVTHHVIGR